MAIPFLKDVDLNQNELQNAVLQNLASAPENPVAGQMYFDTVDNISYTFDGTDWITGTTYEFANGLTLADGTVTLDKATTAKVGGVIIGSNIDVNNGTISVKDATSGQKGLIQIATDAEFTTGTDTTKAVTTKQVTSALAAATQGMVTETGAQTLTNKTIDADDNTISDLTAANFKSGVVAATLAGTATASATVLASEKAVADAIDGHIKLTDLSIAAASANYLEYNNANGQFGAKVDGTVTESSTNLITSGAVYTAINNAVIGGVIYQGTWTISTSTTDYSGITLPVKKGFLYYVAGEGPATVGGIEWNVGDYLLVNADVAAGGSLAGKVEKIDNTESADIVRKDAAQTLTNKTIDATDNTISNLATSNFASGVVGTVLAGTATAANTVIPSEKAVADALANAVDGMVTETGAQTLTNKTIDADDNTISDLELDNFKAGVVQTVVRATTSAADTAVASELAVAKGLAVKTEKFTVQNAALTPSSGVCTWTITNSLGSADVLVQIFRVADNVQVMAEVAIGASNITVKMNATADIAANTYKAVVIGL